MLSTQLQQPTLTSLIRTVIRELAKRHDFRELLRTLTWADGIGILVDTHEHGAQLTSQILNELMKDQLMMT